MDDLEEGQLFSKVLLLWVGAWKTRVFWQMLFRILEFQQRQVFIIVWEVVWKRILIVDELKRR